MKTLGYLTTHSVNAGAAAALAAMHGVDLEIVEPRDLVLYGIRTYAVAVPFRFENLPLP